MDVKQMLAAAVLAGLASVAGAQDGALLRYPDVEFRGPRKAIEGWSKP